MCAACLLCMHIVRTQVMLFNQYLELNHSKKKEEEVLQSIIEECDCRRVMMSRLL